MRLCVGTQRLSPDFFCRLGVSGTNQQSRQALLCFGRFGKCHNLFLVLDRLGVLFGLFGQFRQFIQKQNIASLFV